MLTGVQRPQEVFSGTLCSALWHHTVCQQSHAVSELHKMRRDREGAVRRFMAATGRLRAAPIFALCGVAGPAFPARLGAMNLFEAFQGAAQAVQQLDAAVRAHARSAELQGVLVSASHSCAPLESCTLHSIPKGSVPFALCQGGSAVRHVD